MRIRIIDAFTDRPSALDGAHLAALGRAAQQLLGSLDQGLELTPGTSSFVWAGARVVREGQELIFISQTGMVQRNAVGGISRMGRPTQGVRVMNIREDDQVSAADGSPVAH